MSYQVLARKWRPSNFGELVGQQQTSQALINALESQRLHHAYLFTGTRGVGKTTIARILAKSLNCDNGITSKPCGECGSCIEISQGNFVDLLEIDAASKTKVEDTRELLDNVQYRPTRGRYKVYLIDEVHMLSGHSFNALLKTLEEPPPHVIFLLATTDPQKMPVTVLSRCLQFHLRTMEQGEIITHLGKILEAENIHCEEDALLPIAKGADGSMRDALSLLDQAIAYCGDKIKKSTVLEMLGSIDRAYAFKLLEAITGGDANELMQAIGKISEYAPDYDELLADWLSLLHQIAVTQATAAESEPLLLKLANEISPADIQLYYQLSLHARRDLSFAPHPRQGFEMAMLRILAFKPQTLPSSLPGKKKLEKVTPEPERTMRSKLEPVNISHDVHSTVKKDKNPGLNVGSGSEKQRRDQQTQTMTEPGAIVKAINETKQNSVLNNPLESKDNIIAQNEAPQAAPLKNKQPLQLSELNERNWYQVTESISIEGNGLQVLLNSIGGTTSGQKLVINYLQKVESLLTTNVQNNIITALKNYFNSADLVVQFSSVEESVETPKERNNRLHELAIDKAHKKLLADRQVSYLVEHLGATLPWESIKLKEFIN